MKISPKVSKFSLGINVARLRKSHRDVISQIARELRRPAPCTLALQQLKRRRLQIKDEIARCLDRLRRLEASSTLPPHMA